MLKDLVKSFDYIFASILVFFIALYRCVSKLKAPCCRFYPTCSAYAIQMFREKGFFVGIPKVLRRISKCHPFNDGGYDPIE